MVSGTIAFIAGVLVFLHLPPDLAWLPPALLAVLGLFSPLLSSQWRLLPLLCALGVAWGWWRVEAQLAGRLPAVLDGATVPARLAVAGVPRYGDGVVRFMAKVTSLDPERPWRGRARLSWYTPANRLAPGDRWHMTLRLKRPRGFANPGTFDYERWLFTRGIQATGYPATRASPPRLLARGRGGLHNLRLGLAERIRGTLPRARHAGLVVALAVGLRGYLDDAQWDVLRRSGTAHLMAISGLHVGLVAGLAYAAGGFAWRRSAVLCRRLPAPRAAAVAAVAAALAYALLAGFALPTQRAFIMVLALAGGALAGRNWPVSRRLAAAALVVVLVEPMALLGPGFWLSFGAVTLILLGMGGRVGVRRHPWWRWGRVHLLVGLGLAPVTAGAFGLAPLIAPLANLVAVPWVGLLVVPLTLAGAALLPVVPAVGGWLLEGAHLLLDLLWPLLEALAGGGGVLAGRIPPPAAAVAVAGAVLLFAPRGLPGRWLGLLWLLPLAAAPRGGPAPGAAEITVLDVGQGLAVVVRTAAHTLVYDTGPRFRSGSDVGEMVLVPYLRALGRYRVDAVVVTHGDSDHAGGLASLREAVPVGRVLVGGGTPVADGVPCRRGQGWRWDGVDFAMLHPGAADTLAGNDGSCVLAVAAGESRLLLTGDLEREGEAALVKALGAGLSAAVLQVPHHGSRTSSTPAFIRAVAPSIGLVSAGHGNRFRVPHPQVLKRLAAAGVTVMDTAACGAIRLTMAPGGVGAPECHRRARPRHWRAR